VTFGERYLNSGGFIGYLPNVLGLLEEYGRDVKDEDDDQLFYTRLFLDENTRTKFSIELDSLSRIFQNLNGMGAHVRLEAEDDGSTTVNFKRIKTYITSKILDFQQSVQHSSHCYSRKWTEQNSTERFW
jgi:hypothetical protein